MTTRFVLELHCEAAADWVPGEGAQLLRAVVDHANVVLSAAGATVARWNLKGELPQVTKGPYPLEEALEGVLPERRGLLRALVDAAKETPFGWHNYPYSRSDYLTDLWGLVENLPLRVLVDALSWYSNPEHWGRGPLGESDAAADQGDRARSALARSRDEPRPPVPGADPADVAFATVNRTAERMRGGRS